MYAANNCGIYIHIYILLQSLMMICCISVVYLSFCKTNVAVYFFLEDKNIVIFYSSVKYIKIKWKVKYNTEFHLQILFNDFATKYIQYNRYINMYGIERINRKIKCRHTIQFIFSSNNIIHFFINENIMNPPT